jgi:hypothetical protein
MLLLGLTSGEAQIESPVELTMGPFTGIFRRLWGCRPFHGDHQLPAVSYLAG